MSQLNYKITLPVAAQMELSAGINAKVMPLMNQAVKAIAKQTAANWQEAVYKAKLWSGEKDAYAGSITWTMTGDFSARVETDYKYAQEIETGRPPRDLKTMLNTSTKVRISAKTGKRFLVIPMRSNTPGKTAHAQAMPQMVYKMAKKLAMSSVVSTGERPSGEVTHLSPKTGMHPAAEQKPYLSDPKTKSPFLVAKRNYAWGDRITAGMLKAAGADKATIKRFQGMVKMKGENGKKAAGYMTFRIMQEGSPGWIIPAQPGQYIVRTVVQNMQPLAVKIFEEAAARTMGGA